MAGFYILSLSLIIKEKLKNDKSEDVRRSVANNLNDISKDHPLVVIEICRKWFGQTEKTDKLLKHACRSLLKAGNTDILRIFGYGDPGEISIKNFKINPKVLKIGDMLNFEFSASRDLPRFQVVPQRHQ
jgi:hypothetical protein